MKNQTYWALGVLVLLIIVVGVCYWVGNPSVVPVSSVDTSSVPGQFSQVSVKMPPLGESFATGHWDGDVWHRTVPPEPDIVMHEGKPLTLRQLLMTAYGKDWEEQVAILNRVIAEAPYSREAYSARNTLAKYDENRERIWDNTLLFERLQPLVNYHPNEPHLLYDLLMFGKSVNLEAAIHYGEEALKYMGGRVNDAFPAHVHLFLGHAYQLVGDYSSAVSHHKQCLEWIRANPASDPFGDLEELSQLVMDMILSGNPPHGPLASKNRPGLTAPVAAPVPTSVISDPVPEGSVPGESSRAVPFLDDDDVQLYSRHRDAALSRAKRSVQEREQQQRLVQQRDQQAQHRDQQEQQRFETFVQELHQIATVKTESDFEKFLVQAMAKRFGGTKTSPAPDSGSSVSADRMRRASQIFRKAQTPAAGLKSLRKVDPDLANTLQRLRR